MENDDDTQMPHSLYPTPRAIRIIENISESLNLNTCSSPKTVKEIGQGLRHKNWMVRLEAVKSLSTLGKQAERVLRRMVHDDNECVRLLAQYELQRLALLEMSSSTPVASKRQEIPAYSDVHRLEQPTPENIQARGFEKQQQRYTPTWRELLEVLLEDPYALEKVTKLLHISQNTLMQWIHSKTNPNFRILQQILDAFPDDYDALLELIQREFPDFVPERSADSEAPREILAPFHKRLSETLRESLPTLRLWSTCQLVLQQAMQQLDPYRTGMIMAIMKCTSPSPGEKVRSLHGYLGLGSSIWTGNWYQQPLLFGSDSLSGYTATVGKIQVIQDLQSDLQGISFYNVDDMRSILVIPILSSDKCAGSLYVASTYPDYFRSRRLELVQQYVECLVRAFNQEEFYSPEQMQLSLIPYQTQISYFNQMQQYAQNMTRKVIIKTQCKQSRWEYTEDEIISFVREQQESFRTRFPSHRPIGELGIPQARYQVEAELFALLSAMSSTERWQDQLA
jgi:transcriptional regulator with XRE-family HTH domain